MTHDDNPVLYFKLFKHMLVTNIPVMFGIAIYMVITEHFRLLFVTLLFANQVIFYFILLLCIVCMRT